MSLDFRQVPLKKIFLDDSILAENEFFVIGLYDDPVLSLHWQLTLSDTSYDRNQDEPSLFVVARASFNKRRPSRRLQKWDVEGNFYVLREFEEYTIQWYGAGNDGLVGPPIEAFPVKRTGIFTTTTAMLSTELLKLEQALFSPMERLAQGLSR